MDKEDNLSRVFQQKIKEEEAVKAKEIFSREILIDFFG